MTINGIWEAYKAIGYRSLIGSKLRGCRAAVDIAAVLGHPLRSIAKKTYLRNINPFSDTVDEDAVDRAWLKMCLKRYNEYLEDGIEPIIVYDGPRCRLKEATCLNRQKPEIEARAKFQQLVADGCADHAGAIKCLEKINVVPQTSKDKFRALFVALGAPYVQSTGEAERTCALMNREGIVDYGITPDGDFLACGGRYQLTSKTQIAEDGICHNGFQTAELDKFLTHLGLDFDTFQQLCIMSGTDFNQNIKQLSWGRAYPLIKRYGSIDAIAAATGLDVSILNHHQVYDECFKIVPWETTVSEIHLEFKPETDTSMCAGWPGFDLELRRFMAAKTAIIAHRERVNRMFDFDAPAATVPGTIETYPVPARENFLLQILAQIEVGTNANETITDTLLETSPSFAENIRGM